ncbi:MAG: Intermembrane phospholipid transport system permease protein MlaE [Desulfovibrio sp.]
MQDAAAPTKPGPIVALGATTIRLLGEMGAVFLFMLDGFRYMVLGTKQLTKLIRQTYIIGARSLFLIALIGGFTGMVLGLQGYYTLIKFGSEGMLGAVVALALIMELGPVLTAIMITGRAGSAMAAEIGVMRISDQVDALAVMDINPMGYLVSPRIAACIISFPLLTAFFDVIGIIGGYVTGVMLLGINHGVYFDKIETSVMWADVYGGFVKSLAFGVIVAVICCYQGYFTHMRRDAVGPEAVSNATTDAVVYSCVLILIADYVLTSFLL